MNFPALATCPTTGIQTYCIWFYDAVHTICVLNMFLFFNIIKCYLPFTFCVYVRDVTFVCSLYSSCCPCYWYTSQLRIILSWHTPSRSYKQSINVVYGHNHCLFWDAQKHISTLNGQNVDFFFYFRTDGACSNHYA